MNQLERTNHELGLQLAEAREEVVKLKADVAELNERLHERTQLFLQKWPRGVYPPFPVVKVESLFPDPPAGKNWHNPDNLTPEEVGIADGWRLCLAQEYCKIPDEYRQNGAWVRGYPAIRIRYMDLTDTYRTKAPLPS